MTANAIDAVFQKLRSAGRKALMPFTTAGDPDLATTAALVQEFTARGAALIEIGFPYSDPIADGSVIQASNTRALAHGLRIDDIFDAIKNLVHTSQTPVAPLVAMVSYSLVHHRGPERFVAQAADAGFAGAIVPDLPVEEADDLARMCARANFKLIQLVTPTTPPERAQRIARMSTGFYCVSVVGITGERTHMPPQLLEQLRWLRGQTDLPLCVGFGISKPEHVQMLRDAVDGIIVASALVRHLDEIGSKSAEAVIGAIGAQVAALEDALN